MEKYATVVLDVLIIGEEQTQMISSKRPRLVQALNSSATPVQKILILLHANHKSCSTLLCCLHKSVCLTKLGYRSAFQSPQTLCCSKPINQTL